MGEEIDEVDREWLKEAARGFVVEKRFSGT